MSPFCSDFTFRQLLFPEKWKWKIAFAAAVRHSQRWLFSRYQHALPDTCYQSYNDDDDVDDICHTYCKILSELIFSLSTFFKTTFENKYIPFNPLTLHGDVHSFCKIFFLCYIYSIFHFLKKIALICQIIVKCNCAK